MMSETEESLWACAAYATRQNAPNHVSLSGVSFTVKAHSEWEAKGKADAIAKKALPDFDQVGVHVSPVNKVWEPEDEIITVPCK